MQTPQNLAELIQKYQAGTANQEELNSLTAWYHSFDDSKAEISVNEGITEQQLAERIKLRLLDTINERNKKTETRILKSRQLGAAVIILILLFGGAAYLFFNQNTAILARDKKLSATTRTVNDITPGGNKAILTLADGSVIILDSAASGILSTQGSIKIEKSDDGSLIYKLNGKIVTEKDESFYNTIVTPRGGQYQITLSDGTKVWLNAASSIRFPVVFTGTERRVEVTGETYFEVAKNKRLPFKVKALGSEVEVLGTHFNINAYDDEASIKTTLLEGKVKISLPFAAIQSANYLLPGQQSDINKSGKIRILENADTEEAVAWKNGRFQFKSADINSILRQISRWYDVDIIYKGSTNLHFTGQLTRNENVSKVFEMLALTGEIHYKIEGKKIIVSL
jgi:transmembrane sensor